jgi:hypothetical protein
MRMLVGTDDGLLELDAGGRHLATRHKGRAVSALGASYPDTWAILDGVEVWRTGGEDGWDQVSTLEGLRGNCIADTRAGHLIGTSEAHLVRAEESGLERVTVFDEVEGRAEWYTPWGGPPDSRSISEDGETVYVNVHVGGIVRSMDKGKTWEPTIDIDADVHRVWATDDQVFAACARGLAVSDDRGDSWAIRTEGLDERYCRGVAVCGDTILVSSSRGPRGGNGGIYRGALRGGSLERCRDGLPESFDDNIDSSWLDAIPDRGTAAFGTADGRVFASEDEGASWTEVASGLPGIRCVLLMPS